MKIGQAVYAHSMKEGKEKRRRKGQAAASDDEETEEVIEEVEVEVDEDGNEIDPSASEAGKTEEL